MNLSRGIGKRSRGLLQIGFLLSLILGVTVTCASATLMTFNNQAAWEAAANAAGPAGAAFMEETFDGAASSFAANSTNAIGSFLTLELIGGVGDTGETGLSGDGFLLGQVDGQGADILSLRFNNADPVIGFGLLGLQKRSGVASLDLSEIGLMVNGYSMLLSEVAGIPPTTPQEEVLVQGMEFLGFLTDVPIDSFSLVHGDMIVPVEGGSEEFKIDGLRSAYLLEPEPDNGTDPGPAPVPEPGTLVLLGSGLFGLAIYGRKRRNA